MFMFPDRNALLDLIDNVTTGIESRIAMCCGDTNPHRRFAYGQVAGPMDGGCTADFKMLFRFLKDGLPFRQGKWNKSIVINPRNGATFVRLPYPPFKGAEPACFGNKEHPAQGAYIDRRFRHDEVVQPPVTGGMKAT